MADKFTAFRLRDGTRTEIEDCWEADDFEDTVAAALIACFETKVKKNKGAAPADRLTEERVDVFRRIGPYIPSPSRILMGDAEELFTPEGAVVWPFDIHNDPLPEIGCLATRPGGLMNTPGVYLYCFVVRRTNTLGQYWHKREPGVLYEMLSMDATNLGIEGERRYFTVTKNGHVTACTQRIPNNRGYQPGFCVPVVEPPAHWFDETSVWASTTLQLVADRRFCWSISAHEKFAQAHLGCMKEEVKSLLYARSLPMTETGRKRPILHLVEAHKRRLRAGTDIDITAFLRGIQAVEIGGTAFIVRPPDSLAPHVSQNSRDRYFPHIDKVPMLPIKEAAE